MRKRVLSILLVLMMVLAMASACTYKNVLYGPWQIINTVNIETGKETTSPYSISYDIRENGDVYLLGNLYGTFTRNGDRFTFTYTNYDESFSGSWVISGSQLLLYRDDKPMLYTMERPKANS